ncbi:ankyrin repeat-containing domain protein [Mycena pura]|uniref:Ankyrin repeat-containing domain protein n=1 Tax=Mycena pura TaxID=153505 RepID=A0AAD6V8R0_9AGAR|nr:ankyrin repeat-containing domain protein [Mycena pura]
MSFCRGLRKLFRSRPSSPANAPSTPEPVHKQAYVPADTSLASETAPSVREVISTDTPGTRPTTPLGTMAPSMSDPPVVDANCNPPSILAQPVLSQAESAGALSTIPSIQSVTVASLVTDSRIAGAEITNSKDLVIDNISLALDVAEKLAGFVQTVPFIAPAAEFLSQIVKAYKEAKDTNDKRDALLGRITGITQDLCAAILRMEARNEVDLIGRLKPDIETYASLLEEASEFAADYHRLGNIRRGAARNLLGSRFSHLQQQLDLFGARFRTNRLVDLSLHQSAMEGTLNQVHDMAVEEKLEKWLRSPPDMAQKQHDTQKLRKEGTGSWFLDGPTFVKWQDNPGSLWIQGLSGTGKSVLSSTVIDKLIGDQQLFKDLRKSSAIAFFISISRPKMSTYPYRALNKRHDLLNGQALPKYQDLWHILRDLLTELGRVYIVLDALDECEDSEHGQLMDLIAMLWRWTYTPLHLLITSQPRAAFTEAFETMSCVLLESEVTEHDIKHFIATELRDNHKLKTWAHRADGIVDRIVHKSNGMFRLAACLLVELSRCKRQNELDKTLEHLPNDLFGIYDRFMRQIRAEDLFYAVGALRWLSSSFETHDPTEVADTIAFDFSNPTHYTYDPSLREDHANAISGWLEGLVTVHETKWGKETLLLAHSSVQDYLMSLHFTDKFGHNLTTSHSHTFIARTCIGYLLHFANHPLNEDPLGWYAASYWCRHLLLSHDQASLLPEAMHLLKDGSKQYNALNSLRGAEPQPALHLCSEQGYIEGARHLLRNGAYINEQNKEDQTPLQIAVLHGDMGMTRLLIENGADINVQGGLYGSAIGAAARKGHTEIINLLFENGADVNAQAGHFGTPLQAASNRGHTEIVRLLLGNGADVNAQSGDFASALHAASSEGYMDIVSLLVEHRADVNAGHRKCGSALQASSYPGHLDIVHLLLVHNANVNAGGGKYGSALQAASYGGHLEIVRLLLERGADVNAGGGKYGSALQAATYGKYPDIDCLLLEHGADVNVQGKYGSTLQASSRWGYTDIVRLLLEHGADVDARGGEYGSSLQAAVIGGHTEIVCLLLEKGADINAHSGYLGTLENGANVDAQGRAVGSALELALERGHTDIVRLLEENGAVITTDIIGSESKS